MLPGRRVVAHLLLRIACCQQYLNGWRREAAVRECFAAARDVALCQRTLNVSLFLLEFQANRTGAHTAMPTSKPGSSKDIAQLAHDAQLLGLGRHPYQLDSTHFS